LGSLTISGGVLTSSGCPFVRNIDHQT
jgi:hypothetical protein